MDEPLRLSTGGGAILQRNPRNANRQGRSFDDQTFPHVSDLRNGEVGSCKVSSYDQGAVDFHSPFRPKRKLSSSHVKAIEFNDESRNATNLAKLKRALTVLRFKRERSPSHILVANNGDLKRGNRLGIHGWPLLCESKLRKSSVSIERIARIVTSAGQSPRAANLQRPARPP